MGRFAGPICHNDTAPTAALVFGRGGGVGDMGNDPGAHAGWFPVELAERITISPATLDSNLRHHGGVRPFVSDPLVFLIVVMRIRPADKAARKARVGRRTFCAC